jgi:hypothetical protein
MFSNLVFFYLKWNLVMLNIGRMDLLRTCLGKFLTITRDIGNNLKERFLENRNSSMLLISTYDSTIIIKGMILLKIVWIIIK